MMRTLIFLIGLSLSHYINAQVTVSTLAQTFAHGGITVHPQTNDIYIGEFGNLSNSAGTRVARVNGSGEVFTFATNMGLANSGNDFDNQGNLIQASWNSGRIWRVAPNGTPTQLTQTPGPVGVVVDGQGDIFVTACANTANQIRRIGAGTSLSEVYSTNVAFSCPNGLTLDDRGDLYAVNWNDGRVFRIQPGGLSTQIANIGGGAGHLVFTRGKLYVAGRAANQIFEVTREGEVSVLAGTGVDGNDDGPADQATFSRPNGIGVSNDGRFLYVTGSTSVTVPGAGSNNQLRVVDLGADFEFDFRRIEGNWLNPATPGQGLMFDFGASLNLVFMSWFTHALDLVVPIDPPPAAIGGASQRWLTALLEIDGNTLSGPLRFTEGGQFDAPPDDNVQRVREIGRMTIEMTACDAGMVSYEIDELQLSNTFPITPLEKFVSPGGFVCANTQ